MFRNFLSVVVLYTASLGFASPATAEPPKELSAIVLHQTPLEMPSTHFLDADGAEKGLDAYAGKFLVVNFWATWCAPCVAEMPTLEALELRLGGANFSVVTIATGRNPPAMIDRFMNRENLKHLTKYRDPKMSFAQAHGVLGLPVTLLVDASGQEIARISGEVDWSAQEVIDYLRGLMAKS